MTETDVRAIAAPVKIQRMLRTGGFPGTFLSLSETVAVS
jgi:hypothetical protein